MAVGCAGSGGEVVGDEGVGGRRQVAVDCASSGGEVVGDEGVGGRRQGAAGCAGLGGEVVGDEGDRRQEAVGYKAARLCW